MTITKLPCFYYPTTVVIVDDNEMFLENLSLNLGKQFPHKLFDSPSQALEFFLSQKENFPSQQRYCEVNDDLLSGIPLHVNISKIHTQLDDPNRFSTPSVVIVDYDMPGMTGIDFCQKLKEYPVKKIMLTGAAENRLAIQAFNDKIIDKFISKSENNLIQSLSQTITELQHEYFLWLSEIISNNITTTTFSLIKNKVFQEFFIKFLKENEVREFYLTDSLGSYLLVNKKGKTVWLVVQSNEQIESYCDIATDNEASDDIINALENREKIICLFSEENRRLPVNQWLDYLHPAKKIEGLNDIYYALVPRDNFRDKL